MTKDTSLSILRAILTLAGTYLVGHNLFGLAVDSASWQIWLGAAVALGSTIWGIVDKTAGIEQIQSAVRSIIISVGGLFVAAGKLNGNTLDGILGLITAILPVIQSYTSKVTVQQMAAGTLVPEIKPGTEPANVPTVYTGQLVKQSPPVADTRAKVDPETPKP